MEYAAGDVQKGPVLLESQLKGMISNSKLHHAVDVYSSYTTYFSHYLYLLLQVWSIVTCIYKG